MRVNGQQVHGRRVVLGGSTAPGRGHGPWELVVVASLTLALAACGDDDSVNQDNCGGNCNCNNSYFPSTDGGSFSYGDGGGYPPQAEIPPEDDVIPEVPVDPDVCVDATDNAVTLYMSADDSNSQAQPVLARHQVLTLGQPNLDAAHPREYEYLNYYTFDYAPAPQGEVALVPELRYRADTGEYSLLVAVVADQVTTQTRRPWNLVFSVDTSGSMQGTPLQNTKHVMLAIAARMRAGDIVSLVSWNTAQSVALEAHTVWGPDDPTLLAVIANLVAGGSTDLHAGLVTAYDLANRNYAPDRLNRVILLSDGGANTGITDEELIGDEASTSEGDGIFLVGVGTSDYYNHQLMDQVTDIGRGAYLYVPDQQEADTVFGPDRHLANLEVAALDVRLEVTLPPRFVLAAFHGEQVSTVAKEVREQHLAPNDQMLYHSNLAYCGDGDPEAEELSFRATWRDPRTGDSRFAALTVPVADLLTASADHLAKSEILVDYARLLVNADHLGIAPLHVARTDLLSRILAYRSLTGDAEMTEIHDILQQVTSP